MQRLSKKIQHVFVMIDEVTGDESGAEFVQGIHDFLSEYGLLKGAYGINTKIIVADASIVDPKIIKRHLEAIDYEPDKIYFRRAQEAGAPLSRHTFNFKWLPAVGINANAYPASAL